MFYKNIGISILYFVIGLNVFSQNIDFPRIMYVNSIDGIQVYSEPSIDSKKITKFIHGECIQVLNMSNNPETVNGITNYWIQLSDHFNIDGIWYNRVWVFGGNLSEQLPEDVPAIIGFWKYEIGNRYLIRFWANGKYVKQRYGGTVVTIGNWSFNGSNFIIIENKNILINIEIINNNEIFLNNFDDYNIKLIRAFY